MRISFSPFWTTVTNLYVIKQSEIKRASGIPYSHMIHVSRQHSCEQENSKLSQKLKTREIELHLSYAYSDFET